MRFLKTQHCFKILLAFTLLIWGVPLSASADSKVENLSNATTNTTLNTIPAIQSWSSVAGHYEFDSNVRIVVQERYADQLSPIATTLTQDLRALTGLEIPVIKGSKGQKGDIILTMGADEAQFVHDGYNMVVSDTVEINGQTSSGVFYGTRTLLQLLKQSWVIPHGTAKDWAVYPERTFMLDNGRKFYSMDFLKNTIREISYLKYNYFHMHFSDNEGFRIESDRHPEIVSKDGFLTKEQVKELIEFAAQYNITIIPEIDMPGHMGQILSQYPDLQLTDMNGVKKSDYIDLSLDESYTLLQEILEEYLALFPGPYFHIGADEYLRDDKYVQYPQMHDYAIKHYGSNAEPRDTFLGFINWADDIIQKAGKTTRIWNDGLQDSKITPVNTQIQVQHWTTKYLSPIELIERGYTLINANSKATYYVMGLLHSRPDNKAVYEDFTATTFRDETKLKERHPQFLGASLQVWADSPDAETPEQVVLGTESTMRVIAQKNWGSPLLTPTYTAFMPLIGAVGNAPGYTGDNGFVSNNNLVLNKKATSSKNESKLLTAEKAMDGEGYNTRWSSGPIKTAWLQADLGGVYDINELAIRWHEEAYAQSYRVQTSMDGKTWSNVYSTTSGTGGVERIQGLASKGRYIRLTGLVSANSKLGYSIYEMQAYGSSPDLALGKAAKASSIEKKTSFSGELVTDGRANTRWSSEKGDTQWVQVDLGQTYRIEGLQLNWQNAYAKAYQIQVSDDAKTWKSLYSTRAGKGGVEQIKASGTGRYVRMNTTKRVNAKWGYSLFNLQVFGTDLAKGKATTASSNQNASTKASFATDGNASTLWTSSAEDTKWLQVDLEAETNLNRIVLDWGKLAPTAYQLQISNDGTNWTTIYNAIDNDRSINDINNLSLNARYVRAVSHDEQTISLRSLQVFGQ
jgi:hexosaminidase